MNLAEGGILFLHLTHTGLIESGEECLFAVDPANQGLSAPTTWGSHPHPSTPDCRGWGGGGGQRGWKYTWGVEGEAADGDNRERPDREAVEREGKWVQSQSWAGVYDHMQGDNRSK